MDSHPGIYRIVLLTIPKFRHSLEAIRQDLMDSPYRGQDAVCRQPVWRLITFAFAVDIYSVSLYFYTQVIRGQSSSACSNGGQGPSEAAAMLDIGQRRPSVSHRSLQCSTRPASWRCRFRSTGTKRCSPSGCSLRRASTRSRPSSALRGSSNAHSHGRQASTGTALLQRRRNRHAGGYRSRWH